MWAINKQRLGAGLIFLLFGAKYFQRTHDAGFTPADKSLVAFLAIFGLYLCVRAFDSLFGSRSTKSDSTQP
jgi:hypothetical protein